MKKKLIFALIVLSIPGMLAAAYGNRQTVPKPDQPARIYYLIDKCLKNNAWEEAALLCRYIRSAKTDTSSPEYIERQQKTDALVIKMSAALMDTLPTYPGAAFNQNTLATVKRILFGNYDCARAREVMEKYLNDRDAVQPKKTTVISQTVDKTHTGLRIYVPEKSYRGYTLFAHCPLDLKLSHYFTPIYLINMQAQIVHQWMLENEAAMLSRLKPDGTLVYANEKTLTEIDRESNPGWSYPVRIDHDFQIMENNNYLTIERQEKMQRIKIIGNDYLNAPAINPRIKLIDRDKNVLWEWKSEEHIDEIKKLVDIPVIPLGDWAHINTARFIGENSAAAHDRRFKPGNILFAYERLSLIGIIEYPSGKVVWAWGPGIIQNPHTPGMLENGTILLFDNGDQRGWSRVIEFNPLTERIEWEYHASPPESFFSPHKSSAEKLPNGNIFVCESFSNRLFEITPQGEIVWDFISTLNKTTGSEQIYRAYRYSPEETAPLLLPPGEKNNE